MFWAEDKNVDAEGDGESEPESSYHLSEVRNAGNCWTGWSWRRGGSNPCTREQEFISSMSTHVGGIF
jgi:hypothetical protein